MLQQDILKTKSNNLIIKADSAGQRIDNFLFNKLKNVPKSRIYRMLRHGEVRINKKRVLPLYKIQPNDSVRIPPFWSKKEDLSKSKPGENLIKLLLSCIVFENSKILVINKPASIASHSGSGINFGVIEILRAARPDLKSLELIHRLDKDTSGCLILAKKRQALYELHHLMRTGEILKEYVLLVRGHWEDGKRIVDVPLLKNNSYSGERVTTVAQTGKEAITIFRPLKIGTKMSLITAELKTGRTHQIRTHASYIGYPIAGDKKYGDKKFNYEMKQLGLNRLFLHAKEIRFVWSDGTKERITVPLGQQLKEMIKQI